MLLTQLINSSLLLGLVVSLYPPSSKVEHLTATNFNSKVIKSKYPYFVEFYAPWCGHCKQLAPTYTSLASKLNGIVKVGAIDCDVEANKPICGQYQVQGFPTIKFFPSNLKLDSGKKDDKKKKSKKGGKAPIDYQGGRTLQDLNGFAVKRVPNLVRKVSSTVNEESKDKKGSKNVVGIKEFLGYKNKQQKFVPKILLVTDKSTTSPLIKGLAINYAAKVRFGILNSNKEDQLLKKFGLDLTGKSKLIWFNNEDLTKFEIYQGKINFDAITEFVDEHLKKNTDDKDEL